MRSYHENIEVYDQRKRYLFTNWSNEDFSQSFLPETRPVQSGSREEDREIVPRYTLVVKAGETVEMSQFEAITCCRHFVDREINKETDKLVDFKEKQKHYISIGSPEARKPYEDKTIQEIGGEATSSPFVDSLREQIRAEERAKIEAENKPVVKEKTDKKQTKEKASEEFGGLAS